VEEFAFKLKLNNSGGDDELDPFTLQQENKRLKAQMAELEEKGFTYIRDEIEKFLG
jgi:hypothetical protein